MFTYEFYFMKVDFRQTREFVVINTLSILKLIIKFPHEIPICFFSAASQELETIKKQYVKIIDAYGCLGVLQVNAGESSVLYLVLVTSCFSVGKIGDSEIFRITQTQFIPLQFQAPGEDKIAEVRWISNS